MNSIWRVALHLDLGRSAQVVASSRSFFVWAFPGESDWTLRPGLASAITEIFPSWLLVVCCSFGVCPREEVSLTGLIYFHYLHPAFLTSHISFSE